MLKFLFAFIKIGLIQNISNYRILCGMILSSRFLWILFSIYKELKVICHSHQLLLIIFKVKFKI